ncbi:MAG: alpha-amylase [Anaerolineales bacterium]|nr:alpha-amylase [Anaerolineales bacterium]
MRYEFHISRKSRKKYRFDASLFALDGSVLLADYAAARSFAAKMSTGRAQPVPASDINAMGLIDESLHFLIRSYERHNPGVISRSLDNLSGALGSTPVEKVLLTFTREFPPSAVFDGQAKPVEYLHGHTAGASHRVATLEEILLLHVTHLNPAVKPYQELFDVSPLRQKTIYDRFVRQMESLFEMEPGFGPGGETLLQLLRAPVLASPNSLNGQLEYILRRWGDILGEAFYHRLLRGLDFIQEDMIRQSVPAGRVEVQLPVFQNTEWEYERFSKDWDWMPRLVLMAKNTYVWLDQLSKKYQRHIHRLDHIPNEELDELAGWGITGLWLIGLWERSQASQRIKHWMGNPDAVASAYSLYDYVVASDLGGDDAYYNLRSRAWAHGIRLAADMVPNHMGIDSKWVIEHPDWFLQLSYPPFPNYTFNSGDLSENEHVGIILEDHYYEKSDAAVVFKRYERFTGETRYLYHGNDGTSMPWNDTAQLDYLKPEVREAVIQAILEVARRFPIIRFDAAMTLAKKHIQRLWFPEPGAGGAIPSRSEHGLTQAEFEARIPNEFWREVVDRVAAEVPDTLLLAEAFWMMEGYFVRTLGMHRVYNSAFMHMLRDEDNAKYRQVMKQTLEFDPQILKRYVNFMNNPDEETAADQFGTTEKYFGVCTLMSTLPGLPMFGHGQFEGFREKYGMEFSRAQWDERVDEGLLRGHEYLIFPLLHRRYLFAEVDHFLLFDFFTPDGYVNEDVFAYSNLYGDQRGLVIYHNKHAHTRGWVRNSAAYMDKGQGELVQRSLAEGLALPKDGYVIFRDFASGQEFIRSCGGIWEEGLFVMLGEYQSQVFLDWRFVDGEQWEQVFWELNGAGVAGIEEKFNAMFSSEDAVETVKKTKPARKKTGKRSHRKNEDTVPITEKEKKTIKKKVVAKKTESGKGKTTTRKRS